MVDDGEQETGVGPARPAGVARRRRQQGGRTNVLKVKLSDAEKAALAARAKTIGVSTQRLLVESALAGGVHTLTERRALLAELLATRRLLLAMGNNVNQIARAVNATGRPPAELGAASAAITRIAGRLDLLVSHLTGGTRP
ncbi:MobC family plasmid mobilization relaxosome protein [Nonomuraea typhae]|uniref:MobC family plasmid mobilization relaxosome protein n=1 Tax=Nonomuraea typhae TaxID=2603600 RepID=UPI0012F918F7|nr:MobC family plasmid mobilization relaxosome protein [Nonomuraea typhae]